MYRPLPQLLLAAGALAIPAQMIAAEVERDLVVEVEVEGSERIHPSKILGRLSTRPGVTVREAMLADDLERLQATGWFLRTDKVIERLGPGRIKVVFVVEELPYIADVELEGLTYFSRSSMIKKLRTRKGLYYNPVTVEQDIRTILDELHDKNFLDAQVTHRWVPETRGKIGKVVFEVDLGRTVRVGKLDFTGLPHGAHPYFLKPRLFNQRGRKLEKSLLDADRNEVERYVRGAGYLDAQVARPLVEWFDLVRPYEERSRLGPEYVPDRDEDNRVVISYAVEPGKRWRLRSVRFTGDASSVTEEELIRAFALPTGVWYDQREIGPATDRALALLRDHGYARAQLIPDEVFDPATREVDLTLNLREGDLYSVGRVDFFGNMITKDAVLRRASSVTPGDLWSDKEVAHTERELMRTGVLLTDPFSRPRVRPNFDRTRPDPEDPAVTQVDVEVDIEEDKTGRFSFNIGFTSESGIVGRIDFSERNFDLWGLMTGQSWRGAAHRLDASASWSANRTAITLGWRNPHLLDSPYSLGVNLARTDSGVLDWDELRHRASLNLGRRFALPLFGDRFRDDFSLSLGYGVYQLEIDDIDADAIDEAEAADGDHYLNHYLSFSQSLDLTDNPVSPSRGFELSLSQQITGGPLPADDEYIELGFNASLYLPLAVSELGGTTYLRLRQRNRFMEPIGDSDEVPFYDRIFGGGAAPRHRGFDDNDLGPTELNRNGFAARVGGTEEWLTTVELVVPIQGLDSGLRGVVFVDIGNVWGEGEDSDPSDLRYAAGFGIRFPRAFPVALDFAWLLDRESGEDGTQFHFTLAGIQF